MFLSSYNKTWTSYLPTPDKASFIRIKIQISSFPVRKSRALVEIASIWCKNAISISDASDLVFYMLAQDHAHSTNSKVGVRKFHTPLSTFDFVFDSSDKMLIKSVLYNLHKVICFIFLWLCYICCDIHVLQIQKINN